MFLELFLFAENMKFLTKDGIHCIFRSFRRGTFFYFMRGHSLVELTENGNRAQPLLIAFIVHEEEDAARHCQEKREATRLGKLQPHTEA